jgi:hypothetical protein
MGLWPDPASRGSQSPRLNSCGSGVTRKKGKAKEKKISSEFATRLRHFGPEDKVYAIVLLRTADIEGSSGRRQTRTEREEMIEAMRSSAEQALGDVDDILAHFDGQRLADRPDAIGAVPVETTPAGIKALASSKWVKAILEDQSIHLTH